MILVDSNILIDIFSCDPSYFDWSMEQLEREGAESRLFINPVVAGEVAVQRFTSLEEFQSTMAAMLIDIEDLSSDAGFVAGKAFQRYLARRKAHGEGAKRVIADFFIGAQAQSMGATILTRDPRFFRAYFPTVPLITPERDQND